MRERWSNGVLERWNGGVMGWWSDVMFERATSPNLRPRGGLGEKVRDAVERVLADAEWGAMGQEV